MKTVNVTILGSTGSIGKQTLSVIDNLNSQKENTEKEYVVRSLAAKGGDSDIKAMLEQVKKYGVKKVAFSEPDSAKQFKEMLPDVEVLASMDGIRELAKERHEKMGGPDENIVVIAVVGAAGLLPTIDAIKTGHRIALANKETLVAGGELVMSKLELNNIMYPPGLRSQGSDLSVFRSEIIPVDSEHSAIWQCLAGEDINRVKRLLLTASGGAFRDLSIERLRHATATDALEHPTWKMGPKITIDCATMMNKGLEIIEAHWLYNMPYEKITPILHKQSLVHSMVEYVDGSLKAQVGDHNMEIPIQYALTYPDRCAHPSELNFGEPFNLTFEPIDFNNPKYKCLKLAVEAGKEGGLMPAVMNAANEMAVYAFLDGKIAYLEIPEIIERTMATYDKTPAKDKKSGSDPLTVDHILTADKWARKKAEMIINDLYINY